MDVCHVTLSTHFCVFEKVDKRVGSSAQLTVDPHKPLCSCVCLAVQTHPPAPPRLAVRPSQPLSLTEPPFPLLRGQLVGLPCDLLREPYDRGRRTSPLRGGRGYNNRQEHHLN